MTRKRAIAVLALAGALGALAVATLAVAGDGDGRTTVRLTSYEETPMTLATSGRGTLRFRIHNAARTISYELSYSALEGGAVSAAHLHLGRLATGGGVIAFLCGGGDKGGCPASGTVTGVIDVNDIIGPTGQGIDPNEADRFQEVVAAIRARAVYANVHTATYGMGEIRGQLGRRNAGGNGGDDNG